MLTTSEQQTPPEQTVSFTPDQESDSSLTFAQDLVPPTIVPRNVEELATQAEIADPDYPRLKTLDDIQLNGTGGTYYRLWQKKLQDDMAAARLSAEKAAVQQDPDLVVSNLKRLQELTSKFQASQPTKGEAAKAAAEAVVSGAANTSKLPSTGVFGPASSEEAAKLAGRNLLLENIDEQLTKLEDKTKWYHVLTYLGLSLIPGQSAVTAGLYAKDYGKYTGENHYIDEQAAVNEFVRFLVGVPEDQQRVILEGIAANSSNPMFAAEYLAKLKEYTAGQARLDDLFKVIDVVALAEGAKSLLKAGKTANIIKGVGGSEEAAKVVATDILNRINASGLSDSEKVSAALAAGVNPYEVMLEGRKLDGLSPKIQEILKKGTEALGRELRSRLESSGMSVDEVKNALTELRNKYDPSSNPRIHSVQFGEGGEAGQEMVVYWQKADGTAYASKEAAEADMKAMGLEGAEVIELPRKPPTINPQIAWHGSTASFTKFNLKFLGTGEGSLMEGSGFYFTKSRDLAENGYARTQAAFFNEKEGFLYKVDIPENNEMLDWNKYLSDQPEAVQKAIIQLANEGKIPGLVKGKKYDLGSIDQIAGSGADLYKFMGEKLGDAETSKVLRNAGIKGHRYDQGDADMLSAFTRDTGGQKADNFVVYDPKDVKILEKTAVKADEDPFEIAASKMASPALDPYEQKFLDKVKELRKQGKSTNEYMVGNGLGFGDDIPESVRNVVKGWKDLLGFRRKLVVLDERDALDFLARKEIYRIWTPEQRLEFMDLLTSNKGLHLPFGNVSVVFVNTKMMTRQGEFLQTLAHEIGHAFDYDFLRSAHPDVVNAMLEKFYATIPSKETASAMDVREFLRKTIFMDRPNMEMAKFVNSFADVGDDYYKWVTSFSEWYAEQFSRFMLTDARPVGVLEQFFYDLVQKMKMFFKDVAYKYGMSSVEPDELVRNFMNKHLEDVRNGKLFASYTEVPPLGGVNRNIKVPGKPNIRQTADMVPSEPTGGFVIRQKRFDPLSYDNIGKYTDEDIASMVKIAVDPEHGASREAVEQRVVGVHAEAKMKRDFVSYMRKYFDPLTSAQKKRVAAILEEGDSYSDVTGSVGKEFTARELSERGLSEQEIAAYFSARTTRMFVWQLRNGELVRHLGAQGFREFNFSRIVNGVGVRERVIGKALDPANHSSLLNKVVFDARTGKARRVTQEVLDELKAQGGHIAELRDPILDGKKRYRYVLGNTDHSNFRDLTNVFPYRPGEFSRIYTDEYFIKAVRQGEIDGAQDTFTDVLRSARSEREAKEYMGSMWSAIRLMRSIKAGALKITNLDTALEKLIGKHTDIKEFKAAFESGEFDDIKELTWDYSRTKEEYLNNVMGEAQGSGRAFYGKRGGRIYSVDRARDNTLDVFKSLQAEVTNISRVMSLNQWRETNIRKWMNTFGHMIKDRTGDDIADFFKLEGIQFTKNSQESLFAERTHRYILRQIGVKTKEEQTYDSMFRRITEDLEGRTKYRHTGLERFGAWVRNTNFMGFIRNVNFNLTLGMFNPAQLIVQANGAVTAMALHPVFGLKAAKTFPLLRLALMSDNPEVWSKLAKIQKLSDLGLSDAGEFEKLVKAIRKSGILANTHSTALYNIEDGKLNMFANMYRRGIGEKQTFFFDRGEEFNRVVAFDVARREWIKNNPEADWTTNLALKQILIRQDDLTQNMTRANLAAWQSGALSIPFQFLQYNIKLFGNVASAYMKPGRGFTRTEATKLLGWHLALYGAAGNGMAGLVDEMLPANAKDALSVELKAYIGQGMISGLIYSLGEHFGDGGANIAVGSRLGTFDYYQQLAESIYKDPKNIYEVLLGPTYSQTKRLGVIGEQWMLWHKDPDVTSDDILEGLKNITFEQVSSLRNATKAYLYYTNQGRMVDRNNEAMGHLNNTEMLAQALGFQPTVAVDTYNMYKAKKDHDQTMADLANLIMKVQKDIMIEANKGTPEGLKRAHEKAKTLQALWPDNAGDYADVQRRLRTDLFPYDSQLQKLLKEHMWSGMNYDKPLIVTEEPQKQPSKP